MPDPTSLITMLPAPKVGPDIAERLKPKVALAPEVKPLSREEKRRQQELRVEKIREQNFNRKVVPRSTMMGSFAIKTDEEREAEEAAAAEEEERRLAEEEAQRLKYTEQPSITYSQLKAQDSVLSKLKPDDPQFAHALEKNPAMFEVSASDLTAGSWTSADRFKAIDSRDTGENVVKAKFWDSRTGNTIQTNEPSKLHNRKHQINSLAFQHQERAHQLKEHRAMGFQKRQQSMSKYGF